MSKYKIHFPAISPDFQVRMVRSPNPKRPVAILLVYRNHKHSGQMIFVLIGLLREIDTDPSFASSTSSNHVIIV